MRTRVYKPIGFGLDTKMTPMIDVIFQLLIFFLCTAGFTSPEALLPTNLPDHGTVSVPVRPNEDTDIVRVELAGDEMEMRIRMNGQSVPDVADLLGRLSRIAKVSKTTPVVLDVAESLPIGRVIEVYDGCLVAGLSAVHFAARRGKLKP